MQPIMDRLTSGNPESVKCNGSTLERITWREFTPKEEKE
jgi:hypothetical protein